MLDNSINWLELLCDNDRSKLFLLQKMFTEKSPVLIMADSFDKLNDEDFAKLVQFGRLHVPIQLVLECSNMKEVQYEESLWDNDKNFISTPENLEKLAMVIKTSEEFKDLEKQLRFVLLKEEILNIEVKASDMLNDDILVLINFLWS